MSTDPGNHPVTLADVVVVVVTYHPTGDVESRLARMAAQGGTFLVVDNGADADGDRLREICRRRAWDLLPNAANLGIGAALNQGVRRLAGRGARWVLLFDQDSEPAPDLSARLLETWRRHPAPDRVAIVGPVFQDPVTGRRHRVLRPHPACRWLFQKVANPAEDLPSVSMVVTSGSLLRVAAFNGVGPFDEAFFIDFVDTDFCLRCRRHGWLIAVSAAAGLVHSLGHREVRRWLGFRLQPTNHPALRHYYLARNRVPMMRRHAGREPHWFFFECGAALLWGFRVLAAEDHKRKKLRAMLLGTWDGLRGRLGPCPENRRRSLES